MCVWIIEQSTHTHCQTWSSEPAQTFLIFSLLLFCLQPDRSFLWAQVRIQVLWLWNALWIEGSSTWNIDGSPVLFYLQQLLGFINQFRMRLIFNLVSVSFGLHDWIGANQCPNVGHNLLRGAWCEHLSVISIPPAVMSDFACKRAKLVHCTMLAGYIQFNGSRITLIIVSNQDDSDIVAVNWSHQLLAPGSWSCSGDWVGGR